MNTFDLLNVVCGGREKRREALADASLLAALQRGDARSVMEQLHPQLAKPSPTVANCDVCDERPHDRKTTVNGIDTLICEQCDEEEHARMLGRKVVKFRTRDDRDAYEAGSRARGEI